ncbi:enoyl-CoA hydratase domain-containing protein 3, mitochondrial isoform X3 [Ranitomeya imitator]|uniref:enoyl-CoA hydratase domain-containing protein 3, mitochondrial isoform X3 n=1 Tax=Ranitomeya imitator TaxID=111125 RepID=UPI0037E82659
MYSWLCPAAVRAPARAVTALRSRQLGTVQQEPARLTQCVQDAGVRTDKVRLRWSRGVNSRRGRHGMKMGGAVPDLRHPSEQDHPWLMTAIQTIPVPVIAQVNGLATAAGCQLVASCDIAVASEKSRFATPGVNVGLFCSTPAVALGRAVPRKVALEMLFTGEPISAHDALMHGLVSKVVPEDRLEAETMKIASKICQASRTVVALGKATFYKQISQSLEEAYKLTSQVMLQNLMLKDGQEGIEAFTQKRKPVWTNSLE